jgi:hypothetical protein
MVTSIARIQSPLNNLPELNFDLLLLLFDIKVSNISLNCRQFNINIHKTNDMFRPAVAIQHDEDVLYVCLT